MTQDLQGSHDVLTTIFITFLRLTILTKSTNRALCGTLEKPVGGLVSIYHSPAGSRRPESFVHLRQNLWWWKCPQFSQLPTVRGSRVIWPKSPKHSIELRYRERSSAGAFQKWADEVDDQSYTFDNLLPFFKRSVSFTPPNDTATPSNVSLPYNAAYFSATGGPLWVSFPRYLNAITSWLGEAFDELGFQRLPGFFDGRLFGWSYFAYSVDPTSQTRSSSETSFLREALRQTTNLNFYKTTLVKKILLQDCKVATGVVVNTAGVEYIISAKKEVILSAGAVCHLAPLRPNPH